MLSVRKIQKNVYKKQAAFQVMLHSEIIHSVFEKKCDKILRVTFCLLCTKIPLFLRMESSFVVPSSINGVLTETFTQNTICIRQILIQLLFPVSRPP